MEIVKIIIDIIVMIAKSGIIEMIKGIVTWIVSLINGQAFIPKAVAV